MEGTILYHASKEIVEFPEIRKTRFTKDFSWGFYCIKNLKQAVRWANRGFGEPVVNRYVYRPVPGLKILKFETMTDEWLDFIARCRAGGTHDYDIVDGPMANDTVWNYVNDFIKGNIRILIIWNAATEKVVCWNEGMSRGRLKPEGRGRFSVSLTKKWRQRTVSCLLPEPSP